MSQSSNCYWFRLVANTVRRHAEQNGGAIAVVKSEYRQVLIEMEPGLAHCPESVWRHYRVAFARYGLQACSLNDKPMNGKPGSDKELLIHLKEVTEPEARVLVGWCHEPDEPAELAAGYDYLTSAFSHA